MIDSRIKYLLSTVVVLLFAQAFVGSAAPSFAGRRRGDDSLVVSPDSSALRTLDGRPADPAPSPAGQRNARRAAREEARRREEFNALPQQTRDSIAGARIDSLVSAKADSLAGADSLRRDSTRQARPAQAFLDDPITGQNSDSLVYDVLNKMIYIYNQGDVTYQNSNLKADYMQIDMDTKLIYAYGKPDTLDGKPVITKPEFSEGSASYRMDTITYNLSSKKAKIKGVATQQGDGWLVGGSVKKMADNTVNIQGGKYTTCDYTDHPHFYLAMTKAKVNPGKKVVTGPAYLVMEDVPIYFLGIP
ncbi:MAG: LPS-assembly protein LptD, partial [Alistipes sp.]|nr:LPS-assembly protein LptD [Alistipes sp.]